MIVMEEQISDGLTNSQRWRFRHPEKVKEYSEKLAEDNRKIRKKLKEEIYHMLGNKCSNPNCLVPNGCRDVRCLQIDHINGGGQKSRKQFQANYIKYYTFVLQQLKAGSKDYQLLCANCNWIKRVEAKEWGWR
jgi:RNase P subunit RPR2